jgi:hypothetical protein
LPIGCSSKTFSHYVKRQRQWDSFGNGCKISLVSNEPQFTPAPATERNWLPLAIAAAVILVVAALAIVWMEHGRKSPNFTPLTAAPDPYAASLHISNLAMSETGNMAGAHLVYVDGRIANQGPRTVTAVSVQVIFRNYSHEVAQNETQSLRLIRIRDPYVDLEAVSAAPLKPGDAKDFRLIFDGVKADWDGAYPEIRIVRVESKQ